MRLLPAGPLALSAPPATDEATELLSLSPGTPMLLHWTMGWPGILDAVGGTPVLVQDGQIAVSPTCSTSLCRANPRTGIGVRADSKILLVVVDGRWSAARSSTSPRTASSATSATRCSCFRAQIRGES